MAYVPGLNDQVGGRRFTEEGERYGKSSKGFWKGGVGAGRFVKTALFWN